MGLAAQARGDYLGVDVNIAGPVSAAAKAEQVLASDALLARIDLHGLNAGRAKRLRAAGAPRDLRVCRSFACSPLGPPPTGGWQSGPSGGFLRLQVFVHGRVRVRASRVPCYLDRLPRERGDAAPGPAGCS